MPDSVAARRSSRKSASLVRYHRPMLRTRLLAALLALLLVAAPVAATWSIVVIDLATGEVAVATATCLTNFDLRAEVTVVVPEFGAAAHQSSASYDNRLINWELFQLGVPVEEILETIKAQDRNKKYRQIGIASLRGDAVTFTGKGTFKWSGGVTGSDGTMVYAIQGNVLTGEPVVIEAERAFLGSTGSIADRLMAAMEGAASMGGDGRCSCSTAFPTNCGSPPPNFTKTSHIATMLVARPGDPLEPCVATGCSDGDYYLALNIAYAKIEDPDPIIELRQLYEQWRLDQVARPDAYRSTTWLPTPVVDAGDTTPVQIVVDLADIDGTPLAAGGAAMTLAHDRLSAGGASLLGYTDHGDGSYTLDVLPGMDPGVDRLRIVVDDGIQAVTLWPPVELIVAAPEPAPWNDPTPIAGLTTPIEDLTLLADGLVVYTLEPDLRGLHTIVRRERPDTQSAFGNPTQVLFTASPWLALESLTVRDDELELIAAGRSPGSTAVRLHQATRESTNEPFGPLSPIAELDSTLGEGDPFLSPDGRELWFQGNRNGSPDLWHSWRASPDARWMPPTELSTIETGQESSPLISPDRTRLYFAGGPDGTQLLTATRIADGWSPPILVPGAWSHTEATRPLAVQGERLWWTHASGEPRASTTASTSLTASAAQLSATLGGQVDFQLDAGVARANASYQLVCGAPGAVRLPGSPGAVLPLTPDATTELCLAGAPPYQSFQGQLDSQGRATATLTLPPNQADPALVGRTLTFAYLTDDLFVGGTATLDIVP